MLTGEQLAVYRMVYIESNGWSVIYLFGKILGFVILHPGLGADWADYARITMSSPDGNSDMAALLWASFITSHLTSIWLWIALIGAPIARFLMWSRKTGATMIGRWLNVTSQPFTALGYVLSTLILGIDIGFSLAGTK